MDYLKSEIGEIVIKGNRQNYPLLLFLTLSTVNGSINVIR